MTQLDRLLSRRLAPEDRATVFALLLFSAIVTLGLASVTHTTSLDLFYDAS